MSLAKQIRYYTEEDYYNLPEDEMVEIIDGEIYAKAAPNLAHQKISHELNLEIGLHIRAKGGSCDIFHAPVDVKLSDNPLTIVQPDIIVVCDKDKLKNGKYCNGEPDFIIEIVSPSNSRHDYLKKLHLYETAGVREYWIVDPDKEKITVYHLEDDFNTDTYTFQDKIKVGIFEDLEIDFSEISKRLV